MSMTLATAWVRRGVAAEFPQKYEVDEAELKRIEKLARLQLQDAQTDLEAAQNPEAGPDEDDDESEDSYEDAGVSTGVTNGSSSKTKANETNVNDEDDDDDMKEYNLSDYSDDEHQPSKSSITPDSKFSMFGNVRSLAYHQPGEEDPYLVLPEGQDGDSDIDERQDLQVLPTDNLILAAKVEDEVPHLEVMVYEDDADNIYVHHDIMLPAIPLCLEWLDYPVGQQQQDLNGTSKDKTIKETRTQGNFVAAGMMAPEIEIWDLDVVDSMYPAAILGQQPDEEESSQPPPETSSKKAKSKKKKKPKPNDTHHVDAVLSLSLNPHHRTLLASGSADSTIKLWDLSTGTCAKSYIQHGPKCKVTSLDWHPSPTHSTLLLSGSGDTHTVCITDMRAPDAQPATWRVEADVEKVKWDPHNPDSFFVATEAGTVHYFNSLTPPTSSDSISKPTWTLQAHDSPVTAFSVNPAIPGFLATGSEDKKVKLWSVVDGKPALVVSRNMEVGRVFSANFAPDEEVAFRLCIAGSRGEVKVWDASTNAAVRKVFAGRVKGLEREARDGTAKERIVVSSGGPGDEDDDSEEDDEEGEGGAGGWESMEED